MSARLILSFILGITLLAYVFAFFQVREQKRALMGELDRRAQILADSLAETVAPLLEHGSHPDLQRIVDRLGNRERLAGVALYDEEGRTLAVTSGLSEQLTTRPAIVAWVMTANAGRTESVRLGKNYFHVYIRPVRREQVITGALAVFHDASYIEAQNTEMWREAFLPALLQALCVALTSLLVVRWSVADSVAEATKWMRELRTGRAPGSSPVPRVGFLKPLAYEFTHLARSLVAARAAAEKEARLREAAESVWTAERLRIHVRNKLQASALFVVSNREPYMHVRRGRSVEAVVPASGLVTALEPILRTCDGTWIAHGAGDADRETVDAKDRLRVPPDEPQYALRRVWLSKEEEEGYYFGFANEGLWPLCHIAHTRPIFRAADWERYREVNQKFANAVLEEMRATAEPVLLVQDYHFALLPRLVKEHRPDARVAIFWHIPWPNPEAFGICPWQNELLDGLLGADLVGFHIQAHCNNFLETVDLALESQVEWERFAVNRKGHSTLVRPFPISVSFEESTTKAEKRPALSLERAALLKELGTTASFLGVGVDRVDYTKGILERFRGVERFLEEHPAYREKFTFVQIGAPSRTHIKRYHDLLSEVEQEADRINWRFQTGEWRPIVLLARHHSHEEILPYYRAADLCLVTSLHDGMNLVAKEFVAAREDEQSVLILSCFTGAARELRDALVINPYDAEQLAQAIRFALEMPSLEKRARMQRLRRVVKENNVYRWAANLITELAEVRLGELESLRAG